MRPSDISRNKAVAAAPAQISNFPCPTMSLLRSDFAQILPDLSLSQIMIPLATNMTNIGGWTITFLQGFLPAASWRRREVCDWTAYTNLLKFAGYLKFSLNFFPYFPTFFPEP